MLHEAYSRYNIFVMVKFAALTLGCKVNQYETRTLSERFARLGFTPCRFDDEVDLYLVNSCSVTSTAVKKSLQQLKRARKCNPNAKIVVTGCWAQLTTLTDFQIPEADLLILNTEKDNTPQIVLRKFPEFRTQLTQPDHCVAELDQRKRTRATIKIQDGCTNRCAYCSIPLTRPELTSRPIDDVKNEVFSLAQKGTKEIVITGIQVGAYGLGTTDNLSALLKDLCDIPGLERIRLSSIELNDITEELVMLMSSSAKICPHIHIPLQAGDDTVLKRMNRHYTSEQLIDRCRMLQNTITDIAITTDIIVGFPGELDAAFQNTMRVCREVGFAKAHVFRFSPRPNTPALSMDQQIPEDIKELRSHQLIALCEELRSKYLQRFIGRVMPVLVEGRQDSRGLMKGFTPNYIPVRFEASRSLSGSIVNVQLSAIGDSEMQGHIVP